MDGVCKYFQSGYCKFRDCCRKQHVKEICRTTTCNITLCTKRHPKPCKYFSAHQVCKFGVDCSYKHVPTSNNREISELAAKIVLLEATIESFKATINDLTRKMEVMKEQKHEGDTSDIALKCTHCDYTARTSTVLKRHMTIKHKSSDLQKISCELCNFKASSDIELENHNINHKHELAATEINRNEHHDESLELSIHKEVRSKDDFNVWSSSPIQGSQTVHKCFTVDCPNMTDNIEPKVNINWIWYTNIPLCDSCIL